MTVASAAAPPTTTAPTAPIHSAMIPARNEPSWPDVPMNSELTAATRPRIGSGVVTWMSVWRTTELIMSPAPTSISDPIESATFSDRPNTIVIAP